MTKIRFIGDVHGKFKGYRKRIRNVDYSVQIGDMGIGFKERRGDEIVALANPPFDSMSKGKHWFIRGNHDNPESCRRHPFWIPDGSYIDGVFYLGGALSVDKHRRIEGLSWWADEECSITELYALVDKYIELRPKIVVTHDCPSSIADMIMGHDKAKQQKPSVTRYALESMFHAHQPELWVFGHWHKTLTIEEQGTTFVCLGELSYMDVIIEDVHDD